MNTRIKENVHKLFELWCEITKVEKGKNFSGIIIESFPKTFNDEQVLGKVPDFAYPCEFENESVQTYSFVLTSDDSKWRFGFCRHDPKTETAMVIITYLPWHDIFLRYLTVLGELRRSANSEFELFLAETYNKGVPEPGANLKLFYNSGQNYFVFQRPPEFQLPSIPENHNLNLYYNFVDPRNMIAIFAAMLAERRIIFTSNRLDKISSCIQAANAFLYPMVWQHIFIPILPMKMKDILSAPMPYLIGVPEAVLQTMTQEELGDVVILNCDKKILKSPFDDVHQMPQELVSQLKKQLNNPCEHIGDRVSKIFLRILVQLIGGYRDAVRFAQGQKITWDRQAFIDSRPPYLRSFLIKMMELQIFQQFIDERLEMLNTGLGFSDEFEIETLRYAEKMGKKGKHYREFLKNVKDKTNPAVKSAVKSVKEGSRGVKTVYKDLKSKLRDITPPKPNFQTHIALNSSQQDNFHHSAPSSPTFLKKSFNQNPSCNHLEKSKVIQTSNSQDFNLDNNNLLNRNIVSSPIGSPTSSLCLSNMNISKELENHPLFKLPEVDRSLKPSNSLDGSTNTVVRNLTSNTKPNFMDSTQTTDINRLHGNYHNVNNIYFDQPPDTISPPIPPKRSNGVNKINKVLSESKFIASKEIEKSKLIEQITENQIKEEPRIIDDLITLDEQNMSLDIEDFDPLNPNAKLINEKFVKNSIKTSAPVNNITNVHNPLYPYFSPKYRQKTVTDGSKNDDFELLKKYGLDQFSLTNNSDENLKILDKSSWTKFD